MLLKPVQASDEAEFLAAALASRSMHRPWVSPPTTSEAFASFMSRFGSDGNHGYLARTRVGGAPVGFMAVTNIVRGPFCSAYLGYYAFAAMSARA